MEPSILSCSLDFTYEGEKSPALKSITASVPRGKCIVLCGSSGCGKTTLLRCFNHLIPNFYEGTLKGYCNLGGQDLKDLSIGETGRLAASVFQDPRSQFFTLNSNSEIAFGLENFGCSQEKMRSRVEEAFETFSMEKLKNRNVFSLSSGERQLVALLSAWAMDTDLLLLDEPTANLDALAIDQLSEILSGLHDRGKTMVISEHRLYYLKGIADEYWYLDHGQLVCRYPAAQLEAMSPEELQALGLRITDRSQLTCGLQPAPEPSRQDLLQVQDLHFRYGKGQQEILRGLHLTARTGEVVGLLGANGCGKTTLGKQISGLLSRQTGTVTLNGQPLSAKQLQDQSIFIMQEAEFQFFTNSVRNELSYGQEDWDSKKPLAEELLKETGLWDRRNRHPFSLSGGQMQKLSLLLAVLSSKPIVVLDEPTAGLDKNSLLICADLIRRLQKDRIVFLISHDLELLSLVCTRALLIEDGAVIRTFDLREPSRFDALRLALQAQLKPTASPQSPAPSHHRQLDPRGKLFYLVIAMTAGIFTDLPLIYAVFAAGLLEALYEQRRGLALTSVGIMAGLYGLYWLWPTVAASFLVHFFPRVILMGLGAALVISPEEGPRTLAGLRALHCPEKAIMIFSVILRFFPVLQGDLSIMHQSIKTRGFFGSLSGKLRHGPEYLEILIVPMVFRVLRIAEALSASAETRGIGLSVRRESYVSIHWKPADSLMVLITGLSAVLGIIL